MAPVLDVRTESRGCSLRRQFRLRKSMNVSQLRLWLIVYQSFYFVVVSNDVWHMVCLRVWLRVVSQQCWEENIYMFSPTFHFRLTTVIDSHQFISSFPITIIMHHLLMLIGFVDVSFEFLLSTIFFFFTWLFWGISLEYESLEVKLPAKSTSSRIISHHCSCWYISL